MIGSFSINGVESSIFKLVCKSIKRPLLPAAKVNRVEVQGASGAYDFAESEYGIRPIIMRIVYIGTDYYELRTRARQIAAWLSTPTWVPLVINDEPDKFYLAKVTSEIDLQSFWESGLAEVAFDCQPFAYSVNEVSAIFSATGAANHTFVHPGTREINYRSPQGSKSLIKVSGSWTSLGLTMNGHVLTFSEAGASTLLTIDNIAMEVKKAGVNKFDKLGGDIDKFLRIVPGPNVLYLAGVGLNVTVTTEFIPMWV